MKDKLLDFIENHRKLVIFLLIIIVFLSICLGIRACNMSKKQNEPTNEDIISQEVVVQPTLEPDVEEEKKPVSEYQNSLGLDNNKDDDGRVEIIEPEPTEVPEVEPIQTEPTYDTDLSIWGWTAVPNKNMDGSSCKAYLSKVSLSDFGTMWGTSLTEEDFKGNKLYLIGVEQDENNKVHGDLESVGWLINNISNFEANDAIRFTNLHIIGSLSDTHTAFLCSYDWYSAHGLTDTLVVFEDISNSLNADDFKDGDILAFTVYAHNVKVVENVAGQRVVVVQYAEF